MRATQILPSGYQTAFQLNLTQNKKMYLLLNLLGLVLLFAFGWGFARAILWARAWRGNAAVDLNFRIDSLADAAVAIIAVLLLTALNTILHEAIHGLCFYWFTREKPLFAFHWTYAYAAAPGWYLPNRQYLVTGLAPLVVISLVGVALAALLPSVWLLALWFMLTINAAGAVGDLWVALYLLRLPVTCLAQDQGNSITIYLASESFSKNPAT